MSGWGRGRQGVAVGALISAVATAGAVAVLTSSSSGVLGAAIYVFVVTVALMVPAAVAAQVLYGQLMIVSLLMRAEPVGVLLLLPLTAGVIVTAELLAAVAWLDTPIRKEAPQALPDAALSGLVGAGVFGAVAVVGGLPGPTGLGAVALAAGACVVLAGVMLRDGGVGGARRPR